MTHEFSAPVPKRVPPRLSLWTKLAYGAGDMGAGMTSNLIAFYFLFFLTQVAGIGLIASSVVLASGRVWDGVNDPLVGVLSDRTRTRWGRRYPWIFLSALPFGITFILMWIVPDIRNGYLFWYYVIVSVLFQVFFTTSNLPYTTLTAELSQEYDERTDLTSFRLAFSLLGAISVLALGTVLEIYIEDPQKQFAVLGFICAVLSVVTLLTCVFGTYPRAQKMQAFLTPTQEDKISFVEQFLITLTNRGFLFVVGIYLFAWLALQVTATIIPFYTVFWMRLEDPFLPALLVQGPAILMLLPCNLLSRKIGKRGIFFVGISTWIIVQIGLFFVQPGQVGLLYFLCVAASFGVATAYVVPWAMLPDVIEMDELRTGQRREGVFYSFMTLLQKIGLAGGLLLVGVALQWSGFVEEAIEQPDSALLAIRIFMGPVPLVLLCCALVLCYFYPITRAVHEEVMLKLSERRQDGA